MCLTWRSREGNAASQAVVSGAIDFSAFPGEPNLFQHTIVAGGSPNHFCILPDDPKRLCATRQGR
jgi:hypothetical protein